MSSGSARDVIDEFYEKQILKQLQLDLQREGELENNESTRDGSSDSESEESK